MADLDRLAGLLAGAGCAPPSGRITDADIEEGVTNLCRCGTYGRVRKAIHAAAGEKVDSAVETVEAPNGQKLA